MHCNSLINVEFAKRSAEEHRSKGKRYRAKSARDRETFFRLHGIRYSELTRLPYFDAISMTIIDPMHNILLGPLI